MSEVKQKKNRLAEVFTKDYKYEGLVLLMLAIIAIVLGVYFLVQCYSADGTGNPFEGAWLLKDYPKVFSWLLTGLGVVSLLLSIWPYYKPSISEVKRVSWPGKKTMLENCITVFIFVIVFIAFFTLVDLGLKELVNWFVSWDLSL